MPPPPNTAVAATTSRAGEADKALLFRPAVELGCPLACKLSSPVTRQQHGLLSLGSVGVCHVLDGTERTALGHHAKVEHQVESPGVGLNPMHH
jgi:hypothetical protein